MRSVRMERRIASTVKPKPATEATKSCGNRWGLPVSSTANKVAVKGARMVPPRMAVMPSRAQKPVSPNGMKCASSAPSAPPRISSGASTPPDVPDDSATIHTSALSHSKRDGRADA